jgi:chitodextrinase
VRQGATGNGSDWNNAFASLPTTLQRGATYYIADGSYPSYIFNTPNSGTSLITIKKATIQDHGTNTGWNDTYGDGQAVFGSFTLGSDYLVIDGQTRNENEWSDGPSYGFRINGVSANTSWFPGVCASNITVKYSNIGGPDVGNIFTGSEPSSGFYIGGFAEFCTDWTLSRNYVHNTIIPFHMNGTSGGTIEYNWISNSFGKEAIRGQIAMANYTIRYNVMKDACQTNPLDSTSGCTAEIAIWDGSNFDNNQIYGNIIYKTTSQINSGGAIVVGGNGTSWVGPPANNTLIYNNTIAGHRGFATASIIINGGTGNICRNNLWYDEFGTPGCTANTTSNNIEVNADPFVNYAAGDFRLAAATVPGTPLSSPYNKDIAGVTRGADGVWDIGAYEFVSGPSDTTPPSVPTGLSATAISSSQINLSWTASTDNVGVTGYRIYRCQGTSCTPSVQVATSATNSYSDTALSASTAYVYAVAAYDAAGNVSAQSTSASATTTSPTPPVISAVAASSITSNGATITWTTDQPSDTQVEYGLTTAYGSATTLNTSLVTAHSQTLSGLTPNTLYHYRVKSRNASGQLATSGDFTFMTPASPPVISNVQVVNISNNSVTITWNTDKPSTSKVNYGPTSSYTSSTAKDNVLVTSHLVSIDGLNPLTLYHYQVESTDLENLTAVSADSTFTTSPAPIIRQLTNRLLHIFIELSRKILQVIWSH